MEIRYFEQPEQACRAAASVLASQLIVKPESVLGLATGSSPIPMYRELVRQAQDGLVDFSRAVSFNLDEYVGIEADHPCSYHRFMDEHLFSHVNMRREAIHLPDGCAADLNSACAAYDRSIIMAGGIDLQILGIGQNGHIGFNEPGDSFVEETHVTSLAESTIRANLRFFPQGDMPRRAISLGIGGIMRARRIVLIASGPDKAEAIRATLSGDITPRVPSSILRLHPQVTLFLSGGLRV